MLTPIKQLLSGLFGASANVSPMDELHSLQLATAVLLVEVMRADTHHTERERTATVVALRKKFSLSDAEVAALLAHAEHAVKGANDYYGFTSAMNEQFTHAQKVQVVEHMWEVAYADRHLDAHENHLISKIAGLLHVTHGEYIAAKLHAKHAAEPGA